MSEDRSAAVWPVLTFRDPVAMSAFLQEAFGFVETVSIAHQDDPSIIQHAEMRWPLGGGIMFGTAGKDDTPWGTREPGNDAVYLVCDDPDGLYGRAVAAGATVIRELVDEDFGSRTFSVLDPEGNRWSFGTYWGEPVSDPSP